MTAQKTGWQAFSVKDAGTGGMLMNRRKIILALAAVCAVLGILLLFFGPLLKAEEKRPPITAENAANVGALLSDLVSAYEKPAEEDSAKIEADLEAIRAVDEGDFAVAKGIADHWSSVYLDPDYRLYLHQGEEKAAELVDSGIPDSSTHAIVVLGYQLQNGEMQPELKGRCEAAAAVARQFPNTILVVSGGATGDNNPQGHTEAGLMKAYLTGQCGIDAARIFMDERAMTTQENAVNTLNILRENRVKSMTIVTSVYHQRWGQAVYNAIAELYRQQYGYPVEIVGNYSYDIMTDEPMYRNDAQIAVRQIAGILELPTSVIQELPRPGTTAAPTPAPDAEQAAQPEEAEETAQPEEAEAIPEEEAVLPEETPADDTTLPKDGTAAEEPAQAADEEPVPAADEVPATAADEDAESEDPELQEFLGSDEFLAAA